MAIEFTDLKAQYLNLQTSIEARMQAVLRHSQFIMGPEVEELEHQLESFVGTKYCISCASGTDALLLAMMALGIGRGDEVITTPFSFIATAEAIALLGATPVFVDIRPDTFNIAPELIERAITNKTRAIMPVSLYGQCADMDAINAIANEHRLPVIEDAAQSFGATYKNRPSCALTAIGCTSFFPSKPLGCYGDGGACFTDDDALAQTIRQLRVHGQDRRYHHVKLGMNGRLDTLQAAILLAKFGAFAQELQARTRLAHLYDEKLHSIVKTPSIESHNRSAYAQYTIEVGNREKLQAELKIQGIPTSVHYPLPLHLQPAFEELGLGRGDFPVAESAAERVLSLPMHPYLTNEEVEFISSAIMRSVQGSAVLSAASMD